MPVIDAHQHVWDLTKLHYPWLTPDLEPLYRTYEQEELTPELEAAGVDRTVLVQAADDAAETAHMLAVADRHPVVAGVVGWVPLENPDAAGRALDRLARNRAFVGVRHLVHDEPDPDWLLRPTVQESLGLVAGHDLTFDVCAETPRILSHLPALAEAHPTLRLVVDHVGKPPVRDQGWQPWADLLASAARPPTVVAKLSGLGTVSDRADWRAQDWQPYVDHALEVFGPDRLMYGGDWPFALQAGDYRAIWAATTDVLSGLDEAARRQVLGGTAAHWYRIDPGRLPAAT